MDPFDDVLPAAPAARGGRPGGKFAPKAKSKKPLPRKETSDSGAAVLSMQAALALSEVESDLNLTNFPKSACEAGPVVAEVGPDTNSFPEANLSNGSTQSVQPAGAVENISSVAASPSTICSTRGIMEELPKNGKGSLQVGLDLGLRSASDNSVAISESNIQMSFNFQREAESGKFELDPFNDILPDSGTKTAGKLQPKIKPQPRVGSSPAVPSTSCNVMMGRSVELSTSCTNEVQSFHQSSGDGSGGLNQSTNLPIPTSDIPSQTDISNNGTRDFMSASIPCSEDDSSLAAVIPSRVDSFNAMFSEFEVRNETRDLPSNVDKSAGENADIFSGLDSLTDFLSPAATATGKPVLQSLNEKGTEGNFVIQACSSMNASGACDSTQDQRCPQYHTTQDSLTVDKAALLNEDDTCANNRRLETEEGFTNAADNPTLAELLRADFTGVKEDANGVKKNGARLSSLRKHRRSSAACEEDKCVKTSIQARKPVSRKPVNNSAHDDDDLDPPYNPNRDELEENDDEFEVDNSSKKAALSSTKKPVAKKGKTSRKRNKDNEDVEDTTKEPPKKFSHTTQRRKRSVNKALLEIPEDELDPQTLPLKDIILLAEHRERLAKKGATTSKTSSTNQSGGDPFHEDDANIEEEFLGSEDGREPHDDHASESVPLAPSLFNYQSFMDKAPRVKWSKQDTELFYEAVRQFGTDFSMIQQLFPDRSRHQIKLKYKKEERQHPLELADAVNNRAKDHTHFKLVIERLQLASTKADQDPDKEASDFMAAEEPEDLAPKTNEDVAMTEQEAKVKDQEDSVANHSPQQSDESDDDFQRWSQYKSEY